MKDQYVKPATHMVPLGGSTTFRFLLEAGYIYIYPIFQGLATDFISNGFGDPKK